MCRAVPRTLSVEPARPVSTPSVRTPAPPPPVDGVPSARSPTTRLSAPAQPRPPVTPAWSVSPSPSPAPAPRTAGAVTGARRESVSRGAGLALTASAGRAACQAGVVRSVAGQSPALRATSAKEAPACPAACWTLTVVTRRCAGTAPARTPAPPQTVPPPPNVSSPTTAPSAPVLRDCRATPRWSARGWSVSSTRTARLPRSARREAASTSVSFLEPVESTPSVELSTTSRNAPVLSTSLAIQMWNVNKTRTTVCPAPAEPSLSVRTSWAATRVSARQAALVTATLAVSVAESRGGARQTSAEWEPSVEWTALDLSVSVPMTNPTEIL